MRIALATAKNTCEDMINETEEHCRQILDTKNEEYRRKFAELDEKVAAEEDRLARACADTDKYIAAVRRLAEKQEEYLSGLRQITDEARPANPPRAVYNPPIDDNAMPSIPDLEDMEETDTDTFEEINSFVSQVMSEEEAKPGGACRYDQKVRSRQEQEVQKINTETNDKLSERRRYGGICALPC